ncbi:50S ribosomal protein L11 methyltransferase [Rhizobacter sp. AJA081-3]|uniref:50S ribosomal protein L11 methyltransferase n=1 Tax=Rhizobacter sp. AJA081-3 TaxID=2753607 RepID=UPI001ADF844D|nr:50S ribosomal protein L11 methyltransferase [Rhizobacter sp. AJA081-3]QTN23887.1 50S ribosomal protein L11 methyltransferase [Rhizobacter sp. AJA081-3]
MFELLLLAPEEAVEPVSDALIDELGALSASVEDADADTDAEHALFGEPGMPAPVGGWRRSRVIALFADEAAATEAATLLLAQDWACDVSLVAMRPVAEQDWVRLTQSQFAPVEVAPGFWIVPSWHEVPPDARQVIRLDPGLAFGTGTHPTTRMCLRWTAREAPHRAAGWSRVLDYGCGSGILAIGAALHGARGIDAVDIDPAAVESTRANAQANHVSVNAGLPELAQGAYPLVYANILATPLKLLAPLLSAHVSPGGSLVLAGILERQVEELRSAYAPWLDLQVSDAQEGWVLMTALRGAEAGMA